MTAPAPLVWSNSLATHVEEIDEQHQILVNALNEANAKFNGTLTKETIERILQDLLSYAIYHFETEEGLMLEHHYAESEPTMAELHIKQHRDFSATVIKLRDHFHLTGDIDRDATLNFLNSWLVEHIMNTDQHLSRFITNQHTVVA